MMKKIKLLILITILGIGLLGVKAYNASSSHLEKETRIIMDTFVTINTAGPKEITTRAMRLAFERIEQIGVKFNSLNPKSPIYAFNHQGTPISDPEIIRLISLALKVSQESGGAFDITVAPLVELWGFYQKTPRLPQDKQIKDALKNVGYQHLSIRNGKLEKDNQGTGIDLGGIAKGYALVEAIKVLKQEGVTSALIDAGGDVYALGRKRGNKLWRVGIKDPRKQGILGYVEAEDLAVMGSGDYERFFIKNSKRYHHIFSPKTGYPTQGIASVTLIYPDPVLAQAWTKIPFVLGAKEGLEMLEKIPGMEVIIVTDAGEISYSSGLKHIVKIISKG